MVLRSREWSWWILSGVLLGVGFIWPILWWCGVGGVAAFLYASTKTLRLRTALFGGLLAWTIKSAFAISWFWSVYPLDWLGFDSGFTQLAIIAFYWLTISLVLGLGGLAVAGSFHKLRAAPRVVRLVVIPVSWVLGEVGSAVAFSIFNLGPGSDINAFFSAGYVGYLAAYHPWLLLSAKFVGVYSLTVLLVLLGGIFYWLIKQHRYTAIGFVLALLLLPPLVTKSTFNQSDSTVSVALVDTYFVPELIDTKLGVEIRTTALDEAMTAAVNTDATHILLPEDTRYFDTTIHPQLAASLFAFGRAIGSTTIIDSGRRELPDKNVLQAFIYDGAADVVYTPQKEYLVPQGEYLPYFYGWVLRAVGLQALADSYNQTRAYSAGDRRSTATSAVPSVLFCFESFSPTGVRRLVHDNPDVPFIVHPISHSWFHSPQILWQQLDQMLRVQAVWNERAIVSAGNQATGKLYMPEGSIVTPSQVVEGEYWQVSVVAVPTP